MSALKIYTQKEVFSFINIRKGEEKFGEKVKYISDPKKLTEELQVSKAKYVLFGINESIGIKANKGIQGAETTFKNTLKSLLNTQNNNFNKGKKVLILGYLDFSEHLKKSKKLNPNKKEDAQQLYSFVNDIDKEVSDLVFTIIKSGKTPIIIGGGHNNAYGNIKGASLALNTPINVVNFDAHSDFRSLEGRHSGNGFSYAFNEGFLHRYFIFGLHKNYTSSSIFNTLKKHSKQIKYNTFEDITIENNTTFNNELKVVKKFLIDKKAGIEIDLDAVQNIASSAITPSGFSVNKTRQFINHFKSYKKTAYLHICEGASGLENSNNNQTGKLISYLITDFIRK